MADRPATQTQPLTRAQISEWIGGNPRMVRWFEAAIRDISAILPDAVQANAGAAEAAQEAADAALGLVELSQADADSARLLAGAAQAAAARAAEDAAQVQHLIGAVSDLRDSLAALARRVDDLEQGPTP